MPENIPPEKKTRVYELADNAAEDFCRAFGLDPSRVSRLKFDWKAGEGEPLTIEIECHPEYHGLPKEHYPITEIKVDPIEDSMTKSDE